MATPTLMMPPLDPAELDDEFAGAPPLAIPALDLDDRAEAGALLSPPRLIAPGTEQLGEDGIEIPDGPPPLLVGGDVGEAPMPTSISSATFAPLPGGPAPATPGQTAAGAARELDIAGTLDRARGAYAPAAQAAQTVRAFDDAGEQLGRRWLENRRQLAVTTDPAERKRLDDEAAKIDGEARAVQMGRVQARQDADAAIAQGDLETDVAARDLSVMRREQAAEDVARERERRRVELERARTDRAAAAARVRERRGEAAALLKTQAEGDTATTWAGVAALIGEMTSAFAQRRQPDMDGAIKSVLDLGRERLAKQREAAGAAVDVAQADVDELERSMADIEAEGAASDAAILDQAQAALDLEMAKAKGTPREVAVYRAQEAVRTATEQAQAEAEIKQSDAIARRRQAEADIALKAAQASKAQAEANKLMRRGMGAGGTPGPGTLASNVVAIPGTDLTLATFKNTKQGRAEATKAREVVTGSAPGLRVLYEYLADIEDYGTRGLFDQKDWARSPEMAALETARQAIVGPLAKVYAGGYNPSVSMEERAEKAVAFPEGWWQREGTARASVEKLVEQAEDSFREAASGAGIDAAAAERMIKHLRNRAVSSRDIRAQMVEKAEKFIVDANQKPSVRQRAVGALVQRMKRDTGEGATGQAWIQGSIRALQSTLPQLEGEDNADIRATVEAEIARLDAMWGRVGREGIENTEREQGKRARDAAAGPGPKPSKIGGLL
jgi:hypothetical protein